MKVLIIGGGAREHALAWKIAQSPQVKRIYCAPGNGGISQIAQCEPISPDDIEELLRFAIREKIDLTVVGPEKPLSAGIVDRFQEKGLPIIGPSKDSARMETSKSFAKEFMKKYNIPTADFRIFDNLIEAKGYLSQASFPLVIKADGLAAGKGVIIAQTLKEAEEVTSGMLSGKLFGEAGKRIVIEEFLQGKEITVLALTDGESLLPLSSAQDYKKAKAFDKGANTGGMGSISPHPLWREEKAKEGWEKIFYPTLKGLKAEGFPYSGVLYFGLIDTPQGLKVLEFNSRFGDPEAQVVLPRLENDLLELFELLLEGKLSQAQLRFSPQWAVGVVLASEGYPGHFEKGFPIYGLEEVKGCLIFHGGTKVEKNCFLTDGGRVLTVVSQGKTLREARQKSYLCAEKIKFENRYFRPDIGLEFEEL